MKIIPAGQCVPRDIFLSESEPAVLVSFPKGMIKYLHETKHGGEQS